MLNDINLTVCAFDDRRRHLPAAGLVHAAGVRVGRVLSAGVIATQPPWVAGAAPTYDQMIELAGLLVLAGTGAGRWAGLDYFGYAFCSRFCRSRR